jgi:hypothetical protein
MSKSKITVVESRGQFRKPEEGERPSLEIVARGMVNTQLSQKT